VTKQYYIIWRESRAGFFSMIAGFMGHIEFAIKNNLIPVIDLENFPCLYSEKNKIHGQRNVFNYYFESIWDGNLEEIYKSENFILSGGGYPKNFTMSVSNEPKLITIWNDYFNLNNDTQEYIKKTLSNLDINQRTLGVHFRGQELRRARSHPMPMSIKQAKYLIAKELESGRFDKVFVVTEGSNYLRRLTKAFPNKIVFSDSFRTRYFNAYTTSLRPQHYYKLGLEILTDMVLLSKCGGLISASSNVSEMSILLNNGKYLSNVQIRNGKNTDRILFSKFKWYLKSSLPKNRGGFKSF